MGMRVPGAILGATLAAGTLDISYALIVSGLQGIPADRVLQYIASSVLGPDAFAGGAGAAALGLGIHYLIIACMAGAFVLASLRAPILRARPILTGAAYGVLLYLAMRFVFVPLTLVRQGGGGDALQVAGMVAAHGFLVGVPIALFARRAHTP